MKRLIKKRVVLLYLFLLMAIHHVYAAKWLNESPVQLQRSGCAAVPVRKRNLLVQGYCSGYHVPTDLCFFIRCLVYDNPFKYRKKTLPSDLSGQDLRGYDFTGCAFTHTNLTDANLADAILAGTTCDYQKAFQDNIKENKIEGGKKWYQNNLPNDLRSIAGVYPKLKKDTHKAKLLAIATGLAWLPFYQGQAFYIKVQYWSCALLQLKQALGNPYGGQLVCSLEKGLNAVANNYCWTTNYPQHKVNIATKAPHANFDTYLKDFTDGLTKYQCKSKNGYWGFDWYKEGITNNIQGLAATYEKIKDEQLRQKCCNIAHALSKSYQIQNGTFQHHYLFLQHRLIGLKKSVGVMVGNKVYYRHGW